MSLKYEIPKVLGPKDMFLWWCKQKIRNKRHMRVINANSNSAPTMLISTNGDELSWLRKRVLMLAEQIDVLERRDNEKRYFTADTKKIYALKTEIYNSNERIAHLEKVDTKTRQIIMTEKMFRDVIVSFNLKMRDRIIHDAEVINMKNNMGFIYIHKIKRFKEEYSSKSTRMPNWAESKKYKQELIDKGIQPKDKDHPDGKDWIVYWDDDYYMRFAWAKNKGACRVKNHVYYSFIPSNSKSGPKRQLVNANRKNPVLHMKYANRMIYYPRLNPEKAPK